VVGLALDYVRSVSSDSDEGIETYQVLAVLTVIMLLIVPMFAATTVGARSEPANVFNQTDARHNGVGGFTGWQSSLDWMDENTPDEGTFAGADNEMDPYATNAKTDDYEYPEGSYGVLSWWDYGHWITAASDRIPVANPFQQSATQAAEFLLAENESRANEVIGQMSDGENKETRYVVVDWQMATPASKFSAPPAFVEGKNFADYVRYVPLTQQRQGFFLFRQAYYDTMVNRLYRYHGSAQRPQPIVTRYGQSAQVSGVLQTFFRNGSNYAQQMSAAREAINGTPNAQIGGFGPYPSERVPALEHYRLVQTSDRSLNPLQVTHPQLIDFYSGGQQMRQLLNQLGLGFRQTIGLSERNPQWTKVFERVDGATIEGTGPANATVQAAVEMEMPNANNTFTYTQQAQTGPDGTFTMTVPYSTSGYDEYGPENGYTNTSVRATGAYELRTQTISFQDGNLTQRAYNATVDVPEGAVVENGTVSVELSEIETGGQQTTGSLAGPSVGEASQPQVDATG
jgi:dolichyl-diphosphooligosaccharide--protein glycosyltransferase